MDFLLNKVENQRKLLGQDLWPKPLQITIIGDGEYEPLMSCRMGASRSDAWEILDRDFGRKLPSQYQTTPKISSENPL